MTRVDLNQMASLREQILFGAVLVVMVVLFFRVFYSAQAKQADVFRSRLEALKLEKDALVKFASSTPSLGRDISFSRKKGLKIKILLGELNDGNRGGISSMLNEVTSPGFLRGVQVENLSYLPPLRDPGYSKTDFTLNVRGAFTDFLQYLSRLEQFPALLNLQNISLKIAEGQPQDIQAEILGRFYEVSGGGGAP